MGLSLESMAIEMPAVFGHPNRVAFRGVLTLVDVASDRAPAGARGHRVMLTKKAAETAIPSLLGMGLDYSPRLDRHDTRRKIGVITGADIVGRAITVTGFLYGRDFPEIVEEIGRSAVGHQPSALRKGVNDRLVSKELRGNASEGSSDHHSGQASTAHGQLGMSYEIADAVVDDIKAKVWVLNRVTFTGAAVLRRDKAAYQATWIRLG